MASAAGAAAVGLSSPLWPSSSVQAAAPIAALAIISLISFTMDFMKRSGDLQLDLQALNVKIDQVLRNQLLLFQALQAMNEKLDDIRTIVIDLPSEVITLKEVIDAQSLAQRIANSVASLRRRPEDAQALTRYGKERDELYDLSSHVMAAVSATTRPPGLAIAAKHILNCVTLTSNFAKDANVSQSPTDRDQMKAMAFSVMNALQVMTGDHGVRAWIPPYTDKIALRKAELKGSPFYGLLSSANTRDPIFHPREFDERDQSEIAPVDPKSPADSRQLGLCLMTPPNVQNLQSEILHDGGEMRSRVPTGFVHVNKMTRTLTKIKYRVNRYYTYGGRSAYTAEMLPRSSWETETWNQVYRTQTNYPVTVLSSDPPDHLKVCAEMSDSQSGSPQLFLAFQGYLQGYSALAAGESTLLAIQASAEVDLKRATALYDSME